MGMKTWMLTLLFFLAVGSAAAESKDEDPAELKDRRVVVYYLHPGCRSFICRKLERMTAESVAQNFAEQMASGLLEFKSVNYHEPKYAYLARNYKVLEGNKAVVLSEMLNFKEVRKRPLDKMWALSSSPEPDYKRYVREETEDFIRQGDRVLNLRSLK